MKKEAEERFKKELEKKKRRPMSKAQKKKVHEEVELLISINEIRIP
jgi:hypothetical protein